MQNKFRFIVLLLMAFIFSPLSLAANADELAEIVDAEKCCAPNGISYCDLSSGHYVCNDGGYSACICTENAPNSNYQPLMLGCCLWHGGVAHNNFGEVICNDGSRSEICSIQSKR